MIRRRIIVDNFRDHIRARSIVFIQMKTSVSPPITIQRSRSQIAAHATPCPHFTGTL